MLIISISTGISYHYSTVFVSLLLLAIPAWCIRKDMMILPWPIILGIGLSRQPSQPGTGDGMV